MTLTPISDVPGRAQAAHFIRESRKRDPERLERMNGPIYSEIDKAFAVAAETTEKHASPHLSKTSNESAPAKSVQPPQQKSSSEAAKASESLSTETESLLTSNPPEDSSSDIATGGHKGNEHSNSITDKPQATHMLANTTKSDAKSLEAAAAVVTGSTIEFDSEEDTFIEQEGNATQNTGCAITKPHDNSHDNWDDIDITLHMSEDDSSFTAVNYPESSDNEKDPSTTKIQTEKPTSTTEYQV